MDKISIQQEKFCQAYIRLNNLTAAYEEAYKCGRMNKMTIGSNASKLAKEPKIAARIAEIRQEIYERNKITIDELVHDLANMVRFDPAEMYEDDGSLKGIHDMPKPVRQMISSLDVNELFDGVGKDKERIGEVKKIRLMNKLDAIEKLMKHLGGYEKHNQQKPGAVVIYKLPDNGR